MNLDYTDRHVVVTGGTGALGVAVVELLVSTGATVHIPARHAADAARFPLAQHDRVNVVSDIDVTNEQQVQRFYEKLPPQWASVHVAGGFAVGPITETTLDTFVEMFQTNAVTCFLCCREAVRSMRRASGGPGGRIVNVISKPAVVPTAGVCAYAASKAAVANLTVNLAEELTAERIWVNAVAPSIMSTPANRAAMPKADISKWPTVAEVSATIAFLASPQNAVTRGALVPEYGQS